jgi:hypothetical protein
MSTSDDPAVKSKFPMRWTFRQATGDVFFYKETRSSAL